MRVVSQARGTAIKTLATVTATASRTVDHSNVRVRSLLAIRHDSLHPISFALTTKYTSGNAAPKATISASNRTRGASGTNR